MNHNLESILLGEISITSNRDNTTLMAESKEEIKSILMRVKEESDKAGLKLNIQQRSWQPVPSLHGKIDRETMETVTGFICLGSKITADVDCSHEIKRCLLFGRKAIPNLDSILKSRDITLPTKVYLAKAMVFLIVICGCESWMIMKAEC